MRKGGHSMNEIIRSWSASSSRSDIPNFNVGDTVRVYVKGCRRQPRAFARPLKARLSPAVTAASAKRSPSAVFSNGIGACGAHLPVAQPPRGTALKSPAAARFAAPSFIICVSVPARLPRLRNCAIAERFACKARFWRASAYQQSGHTSAGDAGRGGSPFPCHPQRRHVRRQERAASRFRYHVPAVRFAHRNMMSPSLQG